MDKLQQDHISLTDKSEISTSQDEDKSFAPPKHFYWLFLSLSILAIGASFSSTSLSIAVVTIAKEFNLSEPKAFWLGSSAALTSTLVQPCCACLAEIFGRKWSLVISAATLAAGSLLAAVAQNYATIITGRCFQGLGAGGVSAITDIIITDLVPLRCRGQWFAYISVAWAIGTAVGPITSGVLTDGSSWRWLCAISVITCVCAIPPCLWALPPFPRRSNWRASLRKVDYAGFAILSASLIAVLVPVMQATVVYPWKDARTLLPLMLGVTGLFAFLLFESRITSPLIPLARFATRTCLLTFFCTALHGLVAWCLMYYLPLYYQAVRGFTPLESGLAVLPETLTIVPASMAIGFLVGWTGRYRWAIWSGWALSVAGLGLLYMLDESTPTVKWVCLNLPAGLGMGILFGAMGFAIQAAVDAEDVPLAVSLFSFWRAFGATLGISIGSSIFASELELLNNIPRGLGLLSMSLEQRLWATRKIWIFCAAVCGVALLASFGIQSFSLDGPMKKDEVKESGEV